MTAGMKSSEFWGAVVATGIGAYLATTGVEVVVIAAVVAPMSVYIAGRSGVKMKAGE